MQSKDKELLAKAKNYAFLLLKFRLRSEQELRQRMQRKKFSPQVIQETLVFLKEKKFIDDGYFARAWINSRLKKPLGIRRIKQELGVKGISREVIEAAIGEVKEDYPEEEVVAKIIRERLKRLKDIEPRKAKQRVYAYLLRRGFSPEVILDALKQE